VAAAHRRLLIVGRSDDELGEPFRQPRVDQDVTSRTAASTRRRPDASFEPPPALRFARCLANQPLRLRPRLRTTLLASLRRILRRRRKTRPRVPPRLLLQPPDPLLKRRDLRLVRGRQLDQKLATRLAPRVVDRLRLSPIRTPKIRRASPEPSYGNRQLNAYGLGGSSAARDGSRRRRRPYPRPERPPASVRASRPGLLRKNASRPRLAILTCQSARPHARV
jgi:hypothetical protein